MQLNMTKLSPEAPVTLMGGKIALQGRHASTMVMRLLLMVGFAFLFLPLPDLDQQALWLLHHRSVVTHSLAPALVLALLGGRLGAAPVAGGLIGISVHLACDALSPPIGYGQVWWPAPWKISFGDWSQPWLLGSAAVSYLMAISIAPFLFPKGWGVPLVVLTSGSLGAWYGISNEGALSSTLIATAMPLATAVIWWMQRRHHRAALRRKTGRP